MGDLIIWAFYIAFTAGIAWTLWRIVRAILRREFRVYGVSVTPTRYPVSFWMGLAFQTVVGGLVTIFFVSKFLVPTIRAMLAR